MRIDEFLLARIAEDEAVAREASDDGHKWLVEDETISLWPDDREPSDGFMSFPRKAHAYHAATWNPARVLAECEAKRRVVERLRPATITMPNGAVLSLMDPSEARAVEFMHRVIVTSLAQPYADHPDFDPEWRL